MLTFKLFTQANMKRLPFFKNRHGELAHSKSDGHDWAPAQWFEAMVGELGELAEVRIQYENGMMDDSKFVRESSKELADVQTYLVIMSKRFLDKLTEFHLSNVGLAPAQGWPVAFSPAQLVLRTVAHLGAYCNSHKKFNRGDLTRAQHLQQASEALRSLLGAVHDLQREALREDVEQKHPGDMVVKPHPNGINLPKACIDKFNVVSDRVDAPVEIGPDGDVYFVEGRAHHAD